MPTKGRILVVDDEESLRTSLAAWLTEDGFLVDTLDNGKSAIETIQKVSYDAILVDLKMPGVDGLEVLRQAKRYQPQTAVVIITAYATVESAIKAMKEGAYDYLTKPFNPEEVSLNIQKLITHQRLMKENRYLRSRLKQKYDHYHIVSKSKAMENIFEMISTIANTRATVLIQGESGTGKELIAKAIHYTSNRRSKPFISVSCGALVETLLESELFGYEKGAFTDAKNTKRGKFELADGGTIFLDEIGDISPKLQLSLLRVLQEREFNRVGGEKIIKVNVRVIAATNRDLWLSVREGSFRDDLYYRLNVFPIHVPPLRERKEDIPLLAEHFIEKYSYEAGKQIEGIREDALEALIEYDWPGNVRELENVVERAILINKGRIISIDSLPPNLLERKGQTDTAGTQRSLKDVEREHIIRILEDNNWNIKRSAEVLQIDRTTLYSKIKRYGISQPASSAGNR